MAHVPWIRRILKGGPSADDHDRIDDRRRKQISHCAGNGQSFLHKPTHHRDDRTFTDREDQPHETSGKRGEDLVFRQHPIQQLRRQKGVDKSREHRADKYVRSTLKENAEESHEDVADAA